MTGSRRSRKLQGGEVVDGCRPCGRGRPDSRSGAASTCAWSGRPATCTSRPAPRRSCACTASWSARAVPRAHARERCRHDLRDPDAEAAGEARGGARAGHVLRPPRQGPVPRERLHPARRASGRRSGSSRSRSSRSTSSALPPIVAHLARFPRGFIIVTGPTGSGKSTTLAAMVGHHQHRARLPHHDRRGPDRVPALAQARASSISARSAPTRTGSRPPCSHVLRQDPDVILVGEMRDLETIPTGHHRGRDRPPGPLHAAHPGRAADDRPDHRRVPAAQQQQVRVQLSTTLQGVVTQKLVPTVDGEGRAAAAEVMVATPAIRNLIREGEGPPDLLVHAGRRPIRHAHDGHAPGRSW